MTMTSSFTAIALPTRKMGLGKSVTDVHKAGKPAIALHWRDALVPLEYQLKRTKKSMAGNARCELQGARAQSANHNQ